MSLSGLAVLAAVTVSVSNPVDAPRTETVAISWTEAGIAPSSGNIRVVDVRSGKAIPHQKDADGAHLLFSVELQGGETREWRIVDDAGIASADLSTVCWCGHIPERMDDFAWENDRFGARAYGPAIMQPKPKGQGLVSSGIDIFNKCVVSPRLEKWLRFRKPGDPSYHKNHGEGMDNYLVGTSRGCGGLAARSRDGAWLHSINWSGCKMIQTGPVRCEFELTYAAWGGLGQERRRMTLDRGQSLAKMTATFESIPDGLLVGPGLDIAVKRRHAGDMRFSAVDGWIANFEPQDGTAGSIMTALALAPGSGPVTMAVDGDDSLVLLTKPDSNMRTIAYFAGANWTGQGRYATAEDWHRYVAAFAHCLRNPVKVTIKRTE